MEINNTFIYNQHFVAMMNIINKARLNPPASGHKHHIIPKSWFKMHNLPIDNSRENLVLLPYEEHAKIHKLMYHCAKEPLLKRAMAFAYHRLTKGELITNECLKGENNSMYGKHQSEEARRKMSEAMKGRPGHWKGKTFSEEHRRKLSELHSGKTLSDEHRKKISESLNGRQSPTKGRRWKLVNGKRIFYSEVEDGVEY